MKRAGKYVEEIGRSHSTPPFQQACSGNWHHDNRPLRRELNLRQREHEPILKKDTCGEQFSVGSILMTNKSPVTIAAENSLKGWISIALEIFRSGCDYEWKNSRA